MSPLERACNALLLILGQLFVAKVEWIRGGNECIMALVFGGFWCTVTLGALTRLCDFILGKFTVTSRVPGY